MNELLKSESYTLIAETLPAGARFKLGVSGSRITTYGIGGSIPNFIEVQDTESLACVMTLIFEKGLEYKVIGAGSNVLIPDVGLNCYLIKLGRCFRYWSKCDDSNKLSGEFEVGAAMPLIRLSFELSELGFSGLEFAGGIPATVGGATFMNAGAHNSSMSQVIDKVEVVEPDGKVTLLDNSDLKFSYRHSELVPGSIVTKVFIQLRPDNKDEIIKRRANYLESRKAAQPITLPSSGSVFKNPPGELSAGILIERAGLKGLVSGGARISEKHGNWIVNEDRTATAKDVITLIERCKEEVLTQFGILLETELIIW